MHSVVQIKDRFIMDKDKWIVVISSACINLQNVVGSR